MTIRSRTVLDFAGRTDYNEFIHLAACRKRGEGYGEISESGQQCVSGGIKCENLCGQIGADCIYEQRTWLYGCIYLQQPSEAFWKVDHGKYADRLLQ